MTMTKSAEGLLKFVFTSPLQELADDEGRFLGEHIAKNYDDKDDERLLFRDPRDQTGLVANVGALHQVTGAWATVLQLLSPASSDGAPDLLSMLDATRTPVAIIARRWLRGESVPSDLAAAYKASVGYGQILRTWLLRGIPESPPDLHPFLALVDAEGWLIGQDYVCPGSRRAVAEGWTVLCGDPASDFADAPPHDYAAEAEAARPLRDAIGAAEALVFALYAHRRDAGTLDEGFSPGVVFQLARYVKSYAPTAVLRLTTHPSVAAFVAELDGGRDDGFQRHLGAAFEGLDGLNGEVSDALVASLFTA